MTLYPHFLWLKHDDGYSSNTIVPLSKSELALPAALLGWPLVAEGFPHISCLL